VNSRVVELPDEYTPAMFLGHAYDMMGARKTMIFLSPIFHAEFVAFIKSRFAKLGFPEIIPVAQEPSAELAGRSVRIEWE
jgi:hypothetical protein